MPVGSIPACRMEIFKVRIKTSFRKSVIIFSPSINLEQIQRSRLTRRNKAQRSKNLQRK
jgi:hypothetical protein